MAGTAPRLVVRTPDGVERIVELRQGTQVIGHATDADVQIRDDHTAPRHAELTWDGSHLLLRDLGSGVGTTVNGRAVIDWVDLLDGDNIRFGMAEGRVETPGSREGTSIWLPPPSPAPVIQTVGAGRLRRVPTATLPRTNAVLLGGFVGFILAIFSEVPDGSVGPDFETVLIPFLVFLGGGVVAATGASMVRSARSKGV